MNRKLRVLSILAAIALLGFSYDARTTATTASSTGTPTESGLILHIDPATGAIIDAPAPGTSKLDVPASLADRWSTSDEGLIEQPNPSGGKGVYVNLQGRFENGMVTTVDANGELKSPCAQGLNTAANTASQK